MCESVKKNILKYWYALDYLIFECSGKELFETLKFQNKDIKEYLSVKAAFLSNLLEIYSIVEPFDCNKKHSITELKNLKLEAYQNSLDSKKEVRKILKENKTVRNEILNELKSCHSDKKVEIRKRLNEEYIKLSMDTMVLTPLTKKEKDWDKLLEWKGRVCLDSHKLLRNNLMNFAD